MAYTLPTTGTDPKTTTKKALEALIDSAIAAISSTAINGFIYATDTTDGLARTSDGEGFFTASDLQLIFWLNDGGAATQLSEIGTPLTQAQVEELQANYATITAAASQVSEDAAQVALDAAQTALDRDSADAAANRAEAARDATLAAVLTAGVYADTTLTAAISAGLAAVAEGETFYATGADVDYIGLYKDVAGAAVEQPARTPKTSYIAALEERLEPLLDYSLDGYAWAVLDGSSKASIGVKDDGTFTSAVSETGTLSLPAADFDDAETPGYVFSLRDGDGGIALGVARDGTVEVARLTVGGEEAGGGSGSNSRRDGGAYPAQLNFIATQGQSLAGGSDGEITTTQEYDNIGYPGNNGNPIAARPLTIANTATTQGGENPMYGTAGFIKELIARENEVGFTEDDYQLLSCCNGSSGAPIDEINKGGSRGEFENAISQVTAGKSLADSTGRSYLFQAVTWTQGESDQSMPKDTYKGKLIELAADFNTDGKAATGQTRDVQFICYQLCRVTALNTVTPALLEASEEVNYIHVATPTYFMDFYDGTHLKAESSKWLGGYYGLCYKRIVVDQKEWAPLKPVQHAVIGNAVDLYFNKEGLEFDTTMMPAQTNYGFTAVDALDASVAISSVEIVAPNRVRLTFDTAPQAGWRVKYGHISVTGKTNYNGPGGNLRDRAGDTLRYGAIDKPMHNWSVIFNYSI